MTVLEAAHVTVLEAVHMTVTLVLVCALVFLTRTVLHLRRAEDYRRRVAAAERVRKVVDRVTREQDHNLLLQFLPDAVRAGTTTEEAAMAEISRHADAEETRQ